jgi:hypothetical protein
MHHARLSEQATGRTKAVQKMWLDRQWQSTHLQLTELQKSLNIIFLSFYQAGVSQRFCHVC